MFPGGQVEQLPQPVRCRPRSPHPLAELRSVERPLTESAQLLKHLVPTIGKVSLKPVQEDRLHRQRQSQHGVRCKRRPSRSSRVPRRRSAAATTWTSRRSYATATATAGVSFFRNTDHRGTESTEKELDRIDKIFYKIDMMFLVNLVANLVNPVLLFSGLRGEYASLLHRFIYLPRNVCDQLMRLFFLRQSARQHHNHVWLTVR